MASIGGSVRSVSIKGRNFPVAGDSDGSRDLGGYKKTRQVNGDGTTRVILEAKVWKIGGLALAIDDDRNDQDFLQGIMDDPEDVDITVEFASKLAFTAPGSLEEDLEYSTQNATMGVMLSGGGKLRKQ